MFFAKFSTRALIWLVLGALAPAWNAQPAGAQAVMKRLTLKDLTLEADGIMIAKCSKRETVYRNGNIVSRYTLKPSEVWKGQPSLSNAGDLTMEQLGGSLDYPMPITQMVPGSVVMTEGEDLLLFTQAPDPLQLQSADGQPPSLSPNLPRVVGSNMGVFSVVRDPESGVKLVAPGTEVGRANKDQLKRAVNANKAREKMEAQRAVAGTAANTASAAAKPAVAEEEQVKPFETLAAVKSRVMKILGEAQETPAP